MASCCQFFELKNNIIELHINGLRCLICWTAALPPTLILILTINGQCSFVYQVFETINELCMEIELTTLSWELFLLMAILAFSNLVPRAFPFLPWERGWGFSFINV
jgi:hypothetical protein